MEKRVVPIFDLSGERALYYLLDRRPATRCPDIAMLSAPELTAEALRELDAHPPVFVVLEGTKILGSRRDHQPRPRPGDRGMDRRALSGPLACGTICGGIQAVGTRRLCQTQMHNTIEPAKPPK